MLRCRDLGVDPDCDYEIRNASMVAILRRALDHIESEHHIFPIPRDLEDSIHHCMQRDLEDAAPFLVRSS